MNNIAAQWDTFPKWYKKWKKLSPEQRFLILKLKAGLMGAREISGIDRGVLVKHGFIDNENPDFYKINIEKEALRFLRVVDKIYLWSQLELLDAYWEFGKAFTQKDQRVFISQEDYNLDRIKSGMCSRWFSGVYLREIVESKNEIEYFANRNLKYNFECLDIIEKDFFKQIKAVVAIAEEQGGEDVTAVSTPDLLKLIDTQHKGIRHEITQFKFFIDNALHALFLPMLDSDLDIVWVIPAMKDEVFDVEIKLPEVAPKHLIYQCDQVLYDLRFFLKYIETHDVDELMMGGVSAVNHRKIISNCAKTHPLLGDWGVEDLQRGRICYQILSDNNLITTIKKSARKWLVKPSAEAETFLQLNAKNQKETILKTLSIGKTQVSSEWVKWLDGWDAQPMPWKAQTLVMWESLSVHLKQLAKSYPLNSLINKIEHEANPLRIELMSNPEVMSAWRGWRGSPQEIYPFYFLKNVAVLIYFGLVQILHSEKGLVLLLTNEGTEYFNLGSQKSSKPMSPPKCLIVNSDHTLFQTDQKLYLGHVYHLFCDEYIVDGPVKLSKEAILRSIQMGFSEQELINTLQEFSQNKIPPNVVSEIRHLARPKEPVVVTETLLIESNDIMRIASIKEKFSKDFEMINAHMLRYVGKQKASAVKKKLMAKGLL